MSGTAVNRERYTESTRFGRLPATVSISIREPGSALTHFAGLILMAVGAGPLIMRASIYGSVRTVIGVIVFVLTSCMLYAASTAYHTVVLDLKHTTLFRKLDHVSISVMIAGTYTPICLTWLYDSVGKWLLAAIWALALGGVILKLVWITCPKWLSSGVYILMGWLCLFALGPLLSAHPGGTGPAGRGQEYLYARRVQPVQCILQPVEGENPFLGLQGGPGEYADAHQVAAGQLHHPDIFL